MVSARLSLIALSLLVAGLLGCSTEHRIKKLANEGRVGKVLIVDRSANERPKWAKNELYFEKNGKIFFSGSALGMSDLTLSIRQAQAEAKKYMAESIQSRLRVELSASITGSNKVSTGLQRHLSDSIASVVDGVIVSGVVPEEIYWERIAVKPAPKTVETKYNTYVLIQIPAKEYEKAKKDVC